VVTAWFRNTEDPRLKELMEALVKHLHAFLREVRLTEPEWQQAIAINNEAYARATEAAVFGPFFADGSPGIEAGGDISAGAAGEACWVEGTVTGTDGQPVAGALAEVQCAPGRTAATCAGRPGRGCGSTSCWPPRERAYRRIAA
jgi:hydroxyquinol 1,2-dioxygenase